MKAVIINQCSYNLFADIRRSIDEVSPNLLIRTDYDKDIEKGIFLFAEYHDVPSGLLKYIDYNYDTYEDRDALNKKIDQILKENNKN
jgi:hypothetical protein